jgi:hypothetical protein
MRYAFGVTVCSIALCAAHAAAGDFRVETKIFHVDQEDTPVSENLTLYQAGVFFGFLSQPETVTILRPPTDASPGRFIVLDPARSVKMEVATDQIERLLEKLREWAAEQQDPFVHFLGQPKFSEEAAADPTSVTLTSKHMTYRIRAAKSTDDSSLAAYRQFNDWYARFNGLGGTLPFPRLAVNEILFQRKLIPQQVDLEIPAQNLALRAEHRTNWILSKQDSQLIDEARQQMATFREVSPDEFLHGRQEQVADVK